MWVFVVVYSRLPCFSRHALSLRLSVLSACGGQGYQAPETHQNEPICGETVRTGKRLRLKLLSRAVVSPPKVGARRSPAETFRRRPSEHALCGFFGCNPHSQTSPVDLDGCGDLRFGLAETIATMPRADTKNLRLRSWSKLQYQSLRGPHCDQRSSTIVRKSLRLGAAVNV